MQILESIQGHVLLIVNTLRIQRLDSENPENAFFNFFFALIFCPFSIVLNGKPEALSYLGSLPPSHSTCFLCSFQSSSWLSP